MTSSMSVTGTLCKLDESISIPSIENRPQRSRHRAAFSRRQHAPIRQASEQLAARAAEDDCFAVHVERNLIVKKLCRAVEGQSTSGNFCDKSSRAETRGGTPEPDDRLWLGEVATEKAADVVGAPAKVGKRRRDAAPHRRLDTRRRPRRPGIGIGILTL